MKKLFISVAMLFATSSVINAQSNYENPQDSIDCAQYADSLIRHGCMFNYDIDECCTNLLNADCHDTEMLWYDRLSDELMKSFWFTPDKEGIIREWIAIRSFRWVMNDGYDWYCNQEYYIPNVYFDYMWDYFHLIRAQEELINMLLDEICHSDCVLFPWERYVNHGDYNRNRETIDYLANHLVKFHNSDLPSFDGDHLDIIHELEDKLFNK